MTTLAQQVKQIIETECPGTFSLYAGYGMKAGQYVRYPTGAQLSERRNDKGRCTYALYTYADGSRLAYKYSSRTERYSLTVQ